MITEENSVGTSMPIAPADAGEPSPPVRISFVMPCYVGTPGDIHLIGRALESVLTQTDKRCEVVMVHDGYSEKGQSIADGYKPIFRKAGIGFKYLSVPYRGERGGHAACRTGMEIASGEFICLLNGDNIVYPEYVETMYQPYYDVVFGHVLMKDVCGMPIMTGYDLIRGYIDRLNYCVRREIAKWARHQMHMDSDYDFVLSAMQWPGARHTNVNKLIGEHH